jgi:hypothetical protein
MGTLLAFDDCTVLEIFLWLLLVLIGYMMKSEHLVLGGGKIIFECAVVFFI